MSIVEAWSRWLEADADLRNSVLWGLPIVWWGRFGQIAAFLGGLVIILDIVGSEKLSNLGKYYDGILRVYVVGAAAVIVGLVAWAALTHPYDSSDELPGEASTNPWVVLVLLIAIPLAIGAWLGISKVLIWTFNHDRVAFVVRVLSLSLLIMGFPFALLAS
jgi:hypothetical protein